MLFPTSASFPFLPLPFFPLFADFYTLSLDYLHFKIQLQNAISKCPEICKWKQAKLLSKFKQIRYIWSPFFTYCLISYAMYQNLTSGRKRKVGRTCYSWSQYIFSGWGDRAPALGGNKMPSFQPNTGIVLLVNNSHLETTVCEGSTSVSERIAPYV